ncbi:serine protein kinase [Aspergillus heterothallicus]
MSTYLPSSRQPSQLAYISPVDAEPLNRYKPGGYHPILLGDLLHSQRYKVLHKLGWGGYSTVWAARDTRKGAYAAIKICVADSANARQPHAHSRELQTMKELASHPPRPDHTVCMLDHFELTGPNGCHLCLVYELLGPSISDVADTFRGGRLPGKVAKSIAKQSLMALDELHQVGIAHGDLHTRNLAFAMPCLDNVAEEQFLETLGKPETGLVHRRDGQRLDRQVPKYIVRPATPSTPLINSTQTVKLVDFGESFLRDNPPRTLHTPLVVRAPEVIFGDRIDHQVDLWSMGCLLFELFTGQPPFDNAMTTPPILIGQMREMASDDLPERWMKLANTMRESKQADLPGISLQEWLEEVYFDEAQTADLSRENVATLGRIIARLLCFEPSARASAREVLDEPWFHQL